MNTIFSIKNLSCQYDTGSIVLKVPQLNIPKGKLVFVVGVSGGGKSTLLETLGLMNKTIQEGSEVLFYRKEEETVNLKTLWKDKNNELDSFRRKNYSFIFQKTNLMSNFSCGENMILPALFKGQTYKEVYNKTIDYMSRLSLRKEMFDEKTTAISGGQLQRLAFIRAMVADFSVLFGDEPTGNLDAKTAHDMMTVLRKYLIENQKTGIIVSHDLYLAETFADIIIPIELTQDKGVKQGFVNEQNILQKEGAGKWYDSNTSYENISYRLKELITGI